MAVKRKKLSTKLSIHKAAKNIQALLKKHIDKTVALKELRAMLVYLRGNYNDVSYGEGILTLQTDDIYRRNENLGPYNIRLDLTKTLKSLKRRDFYPSLNLRSIQGNYHGHVGSGGGMCVGNGYSVLRKCTADGRIDDFIDVVRQILRT